MQVCLNSGVSIPVNLIFLPFKWIVSPSTTFNSCDLMSLIVKKNTNERMLIRKIAFLLFGALKKNL